MKRYLLIPLLISCYFNSIAQDTVEEKKQKEAKNLNGAGIFWLYTGTNLDFLDGPKLKELYFKASVLTPISVEKSLWIYFTGGKNKFSSANDSILRRSYSDLDISKSAKDSIYIKSGFYKSVYDQITDNIYASPAFLFQLEKGEQSRLFLNVAFYFGLQSIKTSYKNSVLTTNTQSIPINGQVINLSPIVIDNTVKQFNYNMGIGLFHKITTEKFDVRTEFNVGFNRFSYPFLTSRTSPTATTATFYESQKNAYVQVKFEGTVLDPGLSLGFEALIRTKQIPLFNVSLTKVIDLTALGSIFGPVTPSK